MPCNSRSTTRNAKACISRHGSNAPCSKSNAGPFLLQESPKSPVQNPPQEMHPKPLLDFLGIPLEWPQMFPGQRRRRRTDRQTDRRQTTDDCLRAASKASEQQRDRLETGPARQLCKDRGPSMKDGGGGASVETSSIRRPGPFPTVPNPLRAPQILARTPPEDAPRTSSKIPPKSTRNPSWRLPSRCPLRSPPVALQV